MPNTVYEMWPEKTSPDSARSRSRPRTFLPENVKPAGLCHFEYVSRPLALVGKMLLILYIFPGHRVLQKLGGLLFFVGIGFVMVMLVRIVLDMVTMDPFQFDRRFFLMALCLIWTGLSLLSFVGAGFFQCRLVKISEHLGYYLDEC